MITWLSMHSSRACTFTDQVSVCNDHVADLALITKLSYTDHMTDHALITWLHMHWSRNCRQWSRGYHALLMWLSMPWQGSYYALLTCLSWTEHMADHTLITWLHMPWSRDWWCTDHVAIMHWTRGSSYIFHVTAHALITWLIIQWSRGWLCTDYVADHALIS